MALQLSDDVMIVQFMDYVFNNYIFPEENVSRSVWVQFSRIVNKTTNTCESYAIGNSCFYEAHTNIYQLIDVLLEVQSETYNRYKCYGTIKATQKKKKKN